MRIPLNNNKQYRKRVQRFLVIPLLVLNFLVAFEFVGELTKYRSVSFAASTSEEIRQRILAGQNALYQGLFEEAVAIFSALTQDYPSNPNGHFFLALTYRWLTRIDPSSSTYQRQFEKTMRRSISVAQSLLDKKKKDVEAMLYLAASYGYRAEYYQFLKHDWNNAYDDGVKMRKYLEKAEKFPRTTVDVELGYGLYNYYAYLYREKIGWWRFLLSLPKGDKEKGISLLETVRQQGDYAKIEAWYFLIELYKDEKTTNFKLTKQSLQSLQSLRSSKNSLLPDEILARLKHLEDQEFTKEKNFLEALTVQIGKKQVEQYKGIILKYAKRNRAILLSEKLHQTYPNNSFFHTLLAGIYHQNHDWDNSLRTAREILVRAQTTPYYSDYLVYQAKYLIGESSFFKGEYEQALRKFDEIIASQPQQPSYLLPWSHLRRGTIYNLKGQKEKAVTEYKLVLKMKDVHNVHDLARGLLKNQEKK